MCFKLPQKKADPPTLLCYAHELKPSKTKMEIGKIDESVLRLNQEQLSKTISYMLRHVPWEYELELDEEGWVPIEELLDALGQENPKWAQLSLTDLQKVIEQSEKKRHEIDRDKIRALYGHSIPQKIFKEKAMPPMCLYHGTSSKVFEQIMSEGLKPMRRHYVHLSVDLQTAYQVGKRKTSKPIILTIDANRAYREGISFYIGNDKVWLADKVPAVYIHHQLMDPYAAIEIIKEANPELLKHHGFSLTREEEKK